MHEALSSDDWKIAIHTKKGIVHLWDRPSKWGNPDFFRSACNITAQKVNYRDSTIFEREKGYCRKCFSRRNYE